MGDSPGWDVVVVGGGPAGAAAAQAAVAAGARTLVLEQAGVPRAKPCAGLVPATVLGEVEARFGPTPDDALASPAALPVVRLHLDVGEVYPLRPTWPVVRVVRRAFDAHLLARSGAAVRAQARVALVDDGAAGGPRVVLEGGEAVQARCVVVATGAGSPLVPGGGGRRALAFAGRLRYPARRVPAEPGRDLLLLGPALDGLAAIDPDGEDGVAVTTVTKDPRAWKLAHAKALVFATGPLGLGLEAERGAEYGWQVRARPTLGRGRVLAAGDAAGLGLGLGLGLEGALRSGLAAGTAAAQAAREAAGEAAPLRAYAAALAPFVRRRERERGAWAHLRGRVAGWDEAETTLASALRAAPLARRLLLGARLKLLLGGLEREAPPPRGFPV